MDRAKFPGAFAGDVDPATARLMADAQIPWNVAAAGGTVSEAAYSTKPSWYLVATEDHMIPPVTQRFMSKRAGMTVSEAKGSHAIFMSQPKIVADLIQTAARAAAGH